MKARIPRSGQHRFNTPEKKVAEILTRWHKREWKHLLNYCQPSWVQNHPEKWIRRHPDILKANPGLNPIKGGAYWDVRRLFGSMELLEAEITGTESAVVDDNQIIDVIVNVKVKPAFRKKDLADIPRGIIDIFDFSKEYYNLKMTMRLIRENKNCKPDRNGDWYVNPPSCFRIEIEGGSDGEEI